MPDFSCRLIEIDYSGIEAVLTGWFCRDPEYIRLAQLGVHAGLASHLQGRPYDPTWLHTRPDDLRAFFKAIKQGDPILYDRAKRCVHGTSYGLTVHGMQRNFPEIFPDLKTAKDVQQIYFRMAPKVPTWQWAVRQYAHHHHCLGGWEGPPHGSPYGYKHWFWSVLKYTRLTTSQALWRQKRDMPVVVIDGQHFGADLGEDGKRCVAFLPQSTAAGVLKEAMLQLFAEPDQPHYIGDAYFGRTPLRAPIHDSLLLEVPRRQSDRVLEALFAVMTAPVEALPCPTEWGLGPHLAIGVEAKASALGGNWDEMEPVGSAGLGDRVYSPTEELDEDEDLDLGVSA